MKAKQVLRPINAAMQPGDPHGLHLEKAVLAISPNLSAMRQPGDSNKEYGTHMHTLTIQKLLNISAITAHPSDPRLSTSKSQLLD
jgi:hypothetical protein